MSLTHEQIDRRAL